ncbi:hypothetical protein OSTOST_17178 [Ostertagia ostertagi]
MTTSTTTPTPSTTTETTTTIQVTPGKNLTCLFVGDLYNFGKNQSAYEQEKYFIGNTTKIIFEWSAKGMFKAGLALYGYAEKDFPGPGMDCRDSFKGFSGALRRMKVTTKGNGMNTKKAITSINNYGKYKTTKRNVNCVVFLSAQHDTSDLPVLKPRKMDSDATIVAVGFNSTNLEKIVDQKGRAVKVPFAFTSEDVQNVVRAVLFQ